MTQTRTRPLLIPVSPGEAVLVDSAAARVGGSKSDFFRRAIAEQVHTVFLAKGDQGQARTTCDEVGGG